MGKVEKIGRVLFAAAAFVVLATGSAGFGILTGTGEIGATLAFIVGVCVLDNATKRY